MCNVCVCACVHVCIVARLEDEETRHGPIRYASGKGLDTGGMCAAPTGACFPPHTSFAPICRRYGEGAPWEPSRSGGCQSRWRGLRRAWTSCWRAQAQRGGQGRQQRGSRRRRRHALHSLGAPASILCVLCASTQSISHACLWCGNSVDPDGITTSGGIRHRWKLRGAHQRVRVAGQDELAPAQGNQQQAYSCRWAYAEVKHGAPHREVCRCERRGQAPRS